MNLKSFFNNKMRRVFLNILLLCFLIKNISAVTISNIILVIVIFTLYSVLLWLPNTVSSKTRIFMGLSVLILIACFWGGFGQERASIVLMFYLIGYAALRLPDKLSLIFAAIVIATNVIILLKFEHSTMDDIFAFFIVYAGMFAIFRSARIRREANELRAHHFKELQEIHSQLESAHKELQQAHKELEESTVQSLRYAVLEERTRIAKDIHDSIGHGLTTIIVQLQAFPYIMRADSSKIDNTLQTILEITRGCLTEVRTVVHQMAIDDEGIGLIALQSLIKQVREHSGLDIKFTMTDEITEGKLETFELLYRILKEALTNVIRHAEASDVEVTIFNNGTSVIMSIVDNGIFTEQTKFIPGFGLAGIKERCQKVGGSCLIQSRDPHGLALIVKVPSNYAST
ncbi:sensor histidine kinase [Lysinibacillus sp. NPDC092081]|uniref:sensor histidine kinase n=1 Tax=Lysinibacillus sp. NPDC092081 TaxID=3364131 RepID=UPI0037F16CFA